MKWSLIPFFFILCCSAIQANEQAFDGIFVITYDDSKCYMLSDSPVVSFSEDNSTATLTLKGSVDPILTVPISGPNSLQIVYGKYLLQQDVQSSQHSIVTSVEKIKVTEDKKSGKKIISGGKIFIVKSDNKIYTINGTLVK